MIYPELEKRYVSRAELCNALGTNDRQARLYIESLRREGIPVISSSGKSGYKVASGLADVADARAALEELRSKAISIFAAAKPLRKFIEDMQGTEFEQLTLDF